MDKELVVNLVLCTEYERLLDKCQDALTMWDERHAEIYRSGSNDNEPDGELRRLQKKFARAYAALRRHTHDCLQCQSASIFEGHDDSKGSPKELLDDKLCV